MDSGIDAEPTAVVDAQSSEAERVPEPSEDAEVDADQPDSVNVGNDHDDDAGGEEAAGSNDHLAGGAELSAPFADEATVASSQPEESDQSDCCRPAEHDQPDSGQPAEIQSHSGEPAQGQPSVSTEPDEPQVTAEAVADDGEIVSDSEAADGGPNGGAPDEADSTTASIAVEQPSDVSASQLPEPASSTLQKRQHDADGLTNDSNSDNAGVREPQTKKSALEHLRNMKFSKTDPFNDSANSLRFNREDADANARRKRPPADDERDRRRSRYRHGVSPSSHVSSSTDHHNNGGGVADQQKRQRSTMYFLMQSGEQPPVAAQSPAHAFHHHHNLPASLKGVLQTSGHLRQKLESLLSLKDDQVFGLPAEDMECLLMYTFELSMEQDRLLAGRKAQLKQLDQMIQKERDHMDRLVQELPGHARPNVGEMLNGKSPNAAPMKPPAISISDAGGTPGANVPRVAPNFSVPPPGFGSDPMNPIGGPPAPGQFAQPPPPVVTGGHDLSTTQPPPSDFSKPPPSLAGHPPPQPAAVDSKLLPPVGSAAMSFPTPPPAIVHTSSVAMTAPPPIPVNTSVPPPKVAPRQQPSVAAAAPIVSSTVGPLGNFSAPPPPTDFSKPPPADIPHSSSPSQAVFKPATDLPSFKITSSTASVSSSNITAALDLSVSPPSLMMNSPLDAGSKTKSFHNLSQPPPKIHSPASMHQISQSILASVAASLNPHTAPAPRPLMSINQQRPPAGFRPQPSTIPSLASISRSSINIKRPTKTKNQGGRPMKKNLRKPAKKAQDSQATGPSASTSASINSGDATADGVKIAISATVVTKVVTAEVSDVPEADSSSEPAVMTDLQQRSAEADEDIL